MLTIEVSKASNRARQRKEPKSPALQI